MITWLTFSLTFTFDVRSLSPHENVAEYIYHNEEQRSMSKLIAHYTKLETAANDILPIEAIRISMGSFLRFDDSKETKAWHFNIEGEIANQLFHEKRISDEIKQHFGAICFSSGIEREVNGFNFNRGDYKPRMWAQYGDNSKGVCLVFDREKLLTLAHNQFDDIGLVFSDDVQYFDVGELPNFRDDEITLSPENIMQESYNDIANRILEPEHRVPYFFFKHNDWESEQEFRIIVYMTYRPEDLYLHFNDALVGITFGCDCSPTEFQNNSADEDELRNNLNAYNCILDYCHLHSRELDYSRIRWTNGYPSTDPTLQ